MRTQAEAARLAAEHPTWWVLGVGSTAKGPYYEDEARTLAQGGALQGTPVRLLKCVEDYTE
jgi:hypothetical protein